MQDFAPVNVEGRQIINARSMRKLDDRYSVDELGNIWTNDFARRGITQQMKMATHKKGYYEFKPYNGKSVKAHRFIALALIPNPENKPQVNHINGIKNDNRPENLEWVDNRENRNHGIRTGIIKYKVGGDSKVSTFTNEQIKEIVLRRDNGELFIGIAKSVNKKTPAVRGVYHKYKKRNG